MQLFEVTEETRDKILRITSAFLQFAGGQAAHWKRLADASPEPDEVAVFRRMESVWAEHKLFAEELSREITAAKAKPGAAIA